MTIYRCPVSDRHHEQLKESACGTGRAYPENDSVPGAKDFAGLALARRDFRGRLVRMADARPAASRRRELKRRVALRVLAGVEVVRDLDREAPAEFQGASGRVEDGGDVRRCGLLEGFLCLLVRLCLFDLLLLRGDGFLGGGRGEGRGDCDVGQVVGERE